MVAQDKIQKRLETIACPICRQREFTLSIKTERPDGDMLYTALCKGCRYMFPVSAENNLYRLSNPDAADWLKGIHCPKCMVRGAGLDFRCIVSVREIRHFLSCTNCRHEFNEAAPTEVFE